MYSEGAEMEDTESLGSDQSISPRHHPLLSYLRNRRPEGFVVEVDASSGIVAAQELPNFDSVLQRVRNLNKLQAFPAEPPTTSAKTSCVSSSEILRTINRLDAFPPLPSPSSHSAGTAGALEMEAMLREPGMDAPTKGFAWVSLQTSNPEYIARLGRECRLHSLTVEDITNDVFEKAEPFHRRGYTYCMIASEDIYGNEVHIHVCLFRGWVLTIHNRPSTAIQQALDRLEDEFSSDSRADIDQQSGLHTLAHTSWIPYTLVDLDVDWMMETAELLVQEAQETEQLMLRTSSKEQPDVLRRITVARSRIYTQRQRNFSKQRLLMVLSSCANESFIAPQMKLYLRDVYDHIQCCSQRLNFAQEVLSQANSNYVALISIEEAHLANRMNILLGRLTLITVVFIPFNVSAGLFGMNVQVPMRDIPGLGPWCGIVFTGIMVCSMLFLILNRLDQQQQQKEL
eukprot:EG_transcript_7682